MRHRMMLGIAGGALLHLFVIAGCELADAEGESVITYDSAGVKVVVVPAGHAAANHSWSISASPIWRAGDRDDEAGHQLHEVAGAVRFGDGRVAVANAGSNELRFFSELEELVLSSGSRGSGPGEFSGLRSLHRIAGDSLAAVDLSLRRVSIFDERGGFHRSFDLPHLDDGSVLDLVGESGDGWFLYRTVPIMGAARIERGTARLPMPLYRTDRVGQGVRSLGEFPGFEVLVTPMDGRPPMSGLLIFSRNAVVSPAPRGFLLGLGDGYEVGLYDGDGSLVQVLRRDLEPRRVLTQHLEELRREIREAMPDSPMRQIFEQRIDAAPGAFPPYERLLVDAEGVLWVGRYTAPGDESRAWDLFRLDEGMVGTLEVPSSLSILEVGTDYVLGVHTDEFGVEVVEVYTLTRGD